MSRHDGGTPVVSEIARNEDPADPLPEVSVAVSTFRRPHQLERLLSALERQTLDPRRFEVVIVDNGSADGTPDVLRGWLSTTTLRARAFKVDRNFGPAFGRNVAWRNAHGAVIAFTDDDCVPDPAWLTEGLEAICSTRCIVVGRTLPEQDFFTRGPFSRTMHVETVAYLATCNVFYERVDLEAVGGFDEGFQLPGAEDTDLAWRIRDKSGRGFAFTPHALVYHDVRPSRFRDAFWENMRWVGIPRFFALHPEARKQILHRGVFWKASHPKVLLATLGVALAPWNLLFVLLSVPWLRHRLVTHPLPGRFRYRPFVLPGAFILDLTEVYVMLRGSARYRTLVL